MHTVYYRKIVAFSALYIFTGLCPAQNYVFTVTASEFRCEKATANLSIGGLDAKDSLVYIHWSTGENNEKSITGLTEGEHNVNVRIKRKDSISVNRDTTLYFSIEKTMCPVSFSRFFSPNDDLYNDVFNVGNVSYYPNFELQIFNKWGQKVHSQKSSFTPWDGKWNGIDVPDGTYYYVFFYDASKRGKFEKGDVTILR